jgi:uncharacterized protein YggU (UPF0235/DUF167 family)
MAKRRVPSPDPAIRPRASASEADATPRRAADAPGPADGRAGDGRISDEPGADGRRSVVVRVRPGAGRTRVGGRYEGPHGPALIVAVGAPAVDGKATEAVRQALAGALGIRPRDVELKIGATSRDKVFTVAGDVGERIAALRDGSP